MSIAQKHFKVGYALFVGGHSLRTCQNEWQKAGWWAALDAEAAAETSAYLVKMAVR
jgi:hypothetical protein